MSKIDFDKIMHEVIDQKIAKYPDVPSLQLLQSIIQTAGTVSKETLIKYYEELQQLHQDNY